MMMSNNEAGNEQGQNDDSAEVDSQEQAVIDLSDKEIYVPSEDSDSSSGNECKLFLLSILSFG